MPSSVLLIAGALAYLGIALGYARRVYMTERARIIHDEWRRHPGEDPAQRFHAYSHAPVACAACVTGLAWPVLLPGLLLVLCGAAVVTGRPRSTAEERCYRLQEARRRITELESELGFTGVTGGDRRS